MIVLIDNYDSFTYNLVQRLGEINPQIDLQVVRNDQVTAAEIEVRNPSHVIISPGPCTPLEAGISNDLVTLLAPVRLDRLPGWLRVVATTRKEPDVLRRLGGLRAEEIRADEPDNLDDI